jgi:hypothetical protein
MALSENETACPEKRLLVCCARLRMQRGIAEEIREIVKRPLDWDYLLHGAAENSVMPLLGRHLPALASDIVASERIERLKGACRANTMRCLLLTGELIKVLNQFRAQGIPAIPYKGPVLAAQAYGDIALREYEDLDLIICQRDLGKAHDVMLGLGYRARFPWIHSSGYAGATASLAPGEYNYVDDARRIIVELHTESTLRHFPIAPDLGELSQRLVSVSLSGHPVMTFSAEDGLSALCIHGAKDIWERISWVADISELVQAGAGLDWDAVWKRAEGYRAERMVSLGLALAAGLLDAPLPVDVRSRVQKDEVATAIATELGKMLLQRRPLHLSGAARFRFRRRMIAGALAGWRYSMRLAMAPAEEDWEMMRLPRVLAPLYIALRPLRLLQKYGWTGRGSQRLPS